MLMCINISTIYTNLQSRDLSRPSHPVPKTMVVRMLLPRMVPRCVLIWIALFGSVVSGPVAGDVM